MKRTAMPRKADRGLTRRSRRTKPTFEQRGELEKLRKRLFKDAARAQVVCAVSGSGQGFEAHHVVYEQHIRREGGDPWDTRNALRVTPEVHGAHHLASKRIPLAALTDGNYEFAVELFGRDRAYEYLRRRYDGKDPRIAALVDTIELT